MSSDTVISVEGVSKKFCRSHKRAMLYGISDVACDLLGFAEASNDLRPDEFWALKDVSFEIKRGECIGLIGRNGAGKSTLLKLLTGITLPDKGNVKIAGRVGALLELGVGFHPMLTGRENINLTGSILGLSPDEIANKFEAIIDFAGLEEFIDTPVKHYSTGMYVRLGFAIAAHTAPDVFLIDEALSVGDALFQSKCYAKLRDFKDNGVTVVFVTHNLELVNTHCSRALLINKGAVIRVGTPKVVVDHYNQLVTEDRGRPLTECRDTVIKPSPLSSKDMEWSGMFEINPSENRYGSRKAEILEAGIFDDNDAPVQILERNREFVIKVKVRHNQAMPTAVVAYSIKDPKGVVLCGTNTLYQEVDMGYAEKDAVVLVVFRQVTRLNAGHYLLSLGCGAWEKDEYIVYDRRFDYVSFHVVETKQRVGLFDPESVIEWRELD